VLWVIFVRFAIETVGMWWLSTHNFLYTVGLFDSISMLQLTLVNKTFSTKYYVLSKSYLITGLDRPLGLPGG
jgi:hypothetical protein